MRFFILFIIFSSLAQFANAEGWPEVTQCGEYQVKGMARLQSDKLLLVVNEKSKSEFKIQVPIENEAFLAPYINKAVQAKIRITKFNQTKYLIGIIEKIQSRIPNPLNPEDSGIQFILKDECK